MKIRADFPGGNAEIQSVEGDTVYLRPELRDTPHDWFYWCFSVEDAAGRMPALGACAAEAVRAYFGLRND